MDRGSPDDPTGEAMLMATDDFDAVITERDRADLADLDYLPEFVTTSMGPVGVAAMDCAFEDGLSPITALVVGEAAHAAAWRQSPAEFRARMLALNDTSIFFHVARELMERAGLWPWPEDAA